MAKLSVIFTLLLFSICRPEEVEGVAWSLGKLSGFSEMKELEHLLDELHASDRKKPDEIIERIKIIIPKLDHLSEVVSTSKKDRFVPIFKLLRNSRNFFNKFDEFQQNVIEIINRFEQLRSLIANNETNTHSAKYLSVQNVVTKLSFLRPVTPILDSVFSAYFERDNNTKTSLLDYIAQQFKTQYLKKACPEISAQHHFYDVYLEFTILQIGAYLLNKFSWTVMPRNLSPLLGFEDGFEEAEEMIFILSLETRMRYVNDILYDAIRNADRELRRCDPIKWEEHSNFEQITRLVQGAIINEASIGESSTCSGECRMIKDRKITDCYDKDPNCHHNMGSGKILSCESEYNTDVITICPSNNPARRYDYIRVSRAYKGADPKLYDGNIYGKRSSCPREELLLISWTRWVDVCTYCFCLIDEKTELSDRFFNLMEAVTNLAKNEVVTGIRFVKKNRVIYLQIQHGELAPFGLIKEGTVKWKDVDQYDLSTWNDGLYYVTLDNNRKSMELDDIEVQNSNQIVTGVKFSVSARYLYLEVRVTDFDFMSGKLINAQSSSRWISKFSNERYEKLNLKTYEPSKPLKVPRLASQPSLPTSNDFIAFTHSDKKDDASQTTLPLIDVQDVTSSSPTPLSGVGLYHKASKGYGGFIAPKILTLNLENFI